MKTSRFFISLWPFLLMVFGALIFAVGCGVDIQIIEFFGAFVIFLGIVVIADRKWEAEKR